MKPYRHWTPEDYDRLIELMLAGLTRRQIAEQLGRTFRAVKHKLCR